MRPFLTVASVLALGVLAAAQGAVPAAPPAAPDLARRLQARYETIRDFSADFTQTYQGLLLRRAATERGTMQLKKPLRVRFTYESPERKVFVSDGSQFYSYFPRDKSGTVSPLPKDTELSTALMFLAGRGNVVRDFTASMEPNPPAGEWQLRLTPRTPADFDSLTLLVDRQTLVLRGFISVDDQGTNTVRFTNLKENTGLRDAAFLFSFPKGTEISR